MRANEAIVRDARQSLLATHPVVAHGPGLASH